MIIGFEGLPGAGKSTVIRQAREVCHVPFVKEMLVGAEVENDFSEEDYSTHDHAKIVHARVLEHMYGNSFMDRTAYSNLAFRHALGSSNLNSHPEPLELPDHIVYLRIPVEISVKRRGAHGELWGSHKFTQDVAEYYDYHFEHNPNVTIVDNLIFDPRGITAILSSLIQANKKL